MNQTPLTNMEGRYITPSTREAFDALGEMGYNPFSRSYKHPTLISISEYGDLIQHNEVLKGFKQAYYHNGHFYDEPYEELTTTEEKVHHENAFEFFGSWLIANYKVCGITKEDVNAWVLMSEKDRERLNNMSKIDRRLHKNRPLALAIGRFMVETGKIICLNNGTVMSAVSWVGYSENNFRITSTWVPNATLPDDYIFPDQVIEWMHEYEKEEQ